MLVNETFYDEMFHYFFPTVITDSPILLNRVLSITLKKGTNVL